MKKLLVIMLALGLVCLVSVAFAQPDNTANNNDNNEGSAIAQDDALSVGINDVGAAANDTSTAQDGDANANGTSTAQDAKNAANNGTAQDGDANADDSSKAQDAKLAAMDTGVAQDGKVNAAGASPVQLREIDDNNDAVAMDSAKAQDADAAAMDNAVAQDGKVNANGTSPVQVREIDDNNDAVAMDNGVAVEGADGVANDNSVAVGDDIDDAANIQSDGSIAIGDDVDDGSNVASPGAVAVGDDIDDAANILSTDSVAIGDDVENGNNINSDGAIAVGEIEDAAIATDSARSFNDVEKGAAIATDNGVIQEADKGGLNLANLTSSPVQVREVDNDDGAVAMDSAKAMGENDDGAQAMDNANVQNFNGLLDTAAMNSSTALGGKENANSVSGDAQNVYNGGIGVQGGDTSPIQVRETEDNDAVAMDSGKAMDTSSGAAAAMDQGIAQDGNNHAAAGGTGSGHKVISTEDAGAMDNAVAIDDGNNHAVSTGSGNKVISTEGAGAMDNGKAQDGFQNAMDNGKNQKALQAAMDNGVNQAQKVEKGSIGVQAGDSSPIQVRAIEKVEDSAFAMDSATAKNQDGQTNAMDNGIAKTQNGDANAMDNGIAQDISSGGVGVVTGDGSPVQTREVKAENEAAIGMDSAQVVSDPYKSAIAQGSGTAINGTEDSAFTTGASSPALADNQDFAISQSGPAFNDVKNAVQGNNNVTDVKDAAVGNGGMAAQDVHDAAMADNNSIAVQNDDKESAIVVGSGIAVSDPSDEVAINSTQVTKGGKLAVGETGGLNLNVQVPVITDPDNAVQTVALTELKQVNAGVYAGHGSGNTSGSMTVSASNASTTGLQVLSYNMGGVASNVASQNVLNVTNNVGQGVPSP